MVLYIIQQVIYLYILKYKYKYINNEMMKNGWKMKNIKFSTFYLLVTF